MGMEVVEVATLDVSSVAPIPELTSKHNPWIVFDVMEGNVVPQLAKLAPRFDEMHR